MKVRKLDKNGDYSFGQNESDFITNESAILQSVMTKLKLFQNEWWDDQDEGLPLFQAIIRHYGIDSVKAAASKLIENRILEVPEVVSILSKELIVDSENRELTCKFNLETVSGEISGEVSF